MPDKTAKARYRISRRDFVIGAALATATAAMPLSAFQDQPAHQSAEAETQVQTIFNKYGSRLSDAEKADIRRLVEQGQKTIETLRAFPLDNSDEPATIFRVYRSTKR